MGVFIYGGGRIVDEKHAAELAIGNGQWATAREELSLFAMLVTKREVVFS